MSKVSKVPEKSLEIRRGKENLALHRMGFDVVEVNVYKPFKEGITEVSLEAGAPYDSMKSHKEKYESLVSLETKIQDALEKTKAGATMPVGSREVNRLRYNNQYGSFTIRVDGTEQAQELLSQITKDIAPSYDNLHVFREQVGVEYPDRPRRKQFGEAVMKEISAIKKELGTSLGGSITLSDEPSASPSPSNLGNIASSPNGKGFTRG